MPGARYLSPNSRRLSLTIALPGFVMMAAACGCRTTHVVTADGEGRPQFDRLSIVYEVVEPALMPMNAAPPLSLADAKARPWRAAFVSRTSQVEIPEARPEWLLTVQAPHPSGDPDTALVSLLAPADKPDQWQTMAQQSLQRSEVDLLFVHLVNGGVCDNQSRPQGSTRIGIDIDGHRIEKAWTREPRLDRLATETYDAGN